MHPFADLAVPATRIEVVRATLTLARCQRLADDRQSAPGRDPSVGELRRQLLWGRVPQLREVRGVEGAGDRRPEACLDDGSGVVAASSCRLNAAHSRAMTDHVCVWSAALPAT